MKREAKTECEGRKGGREERRRLTLYLRKHCMRRNQSGKPVNNGVITILKEKAQVETMNMMRRKVQLREAKRREEEGRKEDNNGLEIVAVGAVVAIGVEREPCAREGVAESVGIIDENLRE
jgi:hypothetical protein